MPHPTSKASRHAVSERASLALLDRQRCLVERDLHATCALCLDACPVGAIALDAAGSAPMPEAAHGSFNPVGSRGPSIDEESCVRCGACVTACPVGALMAMAPFDDNALLAAAERIGAQAAARSFTSSSAEPDEDANPGNEPDEASNADTATAGFACERLALTGQLDAERTAVLPCLGWIDEALLVHMAAAGARSIVLATALCATCELALATTALAHRAEEARRILNAIGMHATIAIGEEATADLLVNVSDGGKTDVAEGISRRDALAQMRDALAAVATEAASTQVEALTGKRSSEPAEAPESGRRRWQLLDDLHEAGLAANGKAIVPRSLAPRVDIDTEHCSGCALCAQFCPTRALRRVGKAAGGRTALEFDASRCLDCGICAATCRYGALSCEESLTAAELFALEPREIIIPKRRVLPSRR